MLGEEHLRRVLKGYVLYYNWSRPHLSLQRNAPVPRNNEPPSRGRVIAIPQVGGLHHLYTVQARGLRTGQLFSIRCVHLPALGIKSRTSPLIESPSRTPGLSRAPRR